MKRLLFILLMVSYGMVWAEWEMTGTSTDNTGNEHTHFHDKSTIRRNNGLAKMWVMRDTSRPIYFSEGKFKSLKALMAYNCLEETLEVFSFIWYADSMGSGKIVERQTRKESQREFSPIIPGSVGETEWKIACGEK